MTLDERQYDERALPELRALVEALDNLDSDAFEAELSSDILTLEFRDGAKFVINSHRAARQIWMAADRSAWHFDWVADNHSWVAAKTGDELWSTLSRVLTSKLGHGVSLARG
ncbi:MAG TPA: iron donor protein CyaY [Polyangiaceae bacterium]|jgi:CyaY protein|nr:iron donor protein CyaY [Polyangiaceae bacterium]